MQFHIFVCMILLSFVFQGCKGASNNTDTTTQKQTEKPANKEDKKAKQKDQKAQAAEKAVTAPKKAPAKFSLSVTGIENQKPIPTDFAFCVEDGKGQATFGKNISPAMTWKDAPKGTKSFAIVMHDPDVPTKADNVNKKGKTVSKDLKRMDFYHWVLVDIPAATTQLAQAAEGQGVTTGGKAAKDAKLGRRGVNMYTNWFASHKKMKGTYTGYDGPCPPWNDELMHHYHFTVYALDVDKLDVKDGFGGADVVKAMQGHILAQATQIGLYKLNAKMKY